MSNTQLHVYIYMYLAGIAAISQRHTITPIRGAALRLYVYITTSQCVYAGVKQKNVCTLDVGEFVSLRLNVDSQLPWGSGWRLRLETTFGVFVDPTIAWKKLCMN